MLAHGGEPNATELADLYCREARLRIAEHLRRLFGPNDTTLYAVGQEVLDRRYTWL